MLRVCMHTVGMPSNALAGCLDDPEPLSHRLSASLLQAISYSGEHGGDQWHLRMGMQ